MVSDCGLCCVHVTRATLWLINRIDWAALVYLTFDDHRSQVTVTPEQDIEYTGGLYEVIKCGIETFPPILRRGTLQPLKTKDTLVLLYVLSRDLSSDQVLSVTSIIAWIPQETVQRKLRGNNQILWNSLRLAVLTILVTEFSQCDDLFLQRL